MPQAEPGATNADEIAYWTESVGDFWVEKQEQFDRMMGPFGTRGIEALRPTEGERIVDIGCGCGGSALALARRVGAAGAVLGVDVSAPMLELARRRAAEAGADNLRFLEADAQTADLGGGYDGIFSRFGVMFFDDPVAAFANLRGMLKPGGRLAFVCWRAQAENEWATVPMQGALRHLPPLPPPEPGATGAFAMADPDRIRAILGQAGFSGVQITSFDASTAFGDLDQTVTIVLRTGGVGRMLRENGGAKRSLVAASVREVLAARATEEGVLFDAAVWVVSAMR